MRKHVSLFGMMILAGCGASEQNLAVEDHGAQANRAAEAHLHEVTEEHSDQYLKPGAAVKFTQNYDGSVIVGETETFVLSVNPSYSSGNLTLQLSTTEGLDLLVVPEQSFEMTGESFDVPVEFQASTIGKNRFRVLARVDMASEIVATRGYSLTIDVTSEDGNAAAFQKTEASSAITMPDGEKIIRNTAEERIY